MPVVGKARLADLCAFEQMLADDEEFRADYHTLELVPASGKALSSGQRTFAEVPARDMPTIAACANGLKALMPCVYNDYPSFESLSDAHELFNIARRMSKYVDVAREAAEEAAKHCNDSLAYYNWATTACTIPLHEDVVEVVRDNYAVAVECFEATKGAYAEIQEAPSMVLELSAGTLHVAMHAEDADWEGTQNNRAMVAMCIDLEESVHDKARDANKR
ncbi:hypothetical protein GGI20_004660, partial [Coemansia sp. BCRC 34301]